MSLHIRWLLEVDYTDQAGIVHKLPGWLRALAIGLLIVFVLASIVAGFWVTLRDVL